MTSLNGNYNKLIIPKEAGSKSTSKANMTDIGFSQRLSYNINSERMIARPFIEIGVSRGVLKGSSSGDETFSVEGNYNKYNGAVGLELVLENNVVPFVMYDIAKVNLDKNIKYNTTIDGKSVSGSAPIDEGSRKNDSRTLIVGLGFLF